MMASLWHTAEIAFSLGLHEILAFAGVSRDARAMMHNLIEQKFELAREHHEDAPYSCASVQLIEYLAQCVESCAEIARAVFAIEPGLFDDDDFIENLAMAAASANNIALARFISREIICVNPIIPWTVAQIIARNVENGDQFARLFFDERILAECEDRCSVRNMNGLTGFIDYLDGASLDAHEFYYEYSGSDGSYDDFDDSRIKLDEESAKREWLEQPSAGFMHHMIEFCKATVARYPLAQCLVSEQIANSAQSFACYDCCDEIFELCGKGNILIRAIGSYYRSDDTCMIDIARRFVDDDPTIVDDNIKMTWAHTFMTHVSFHGPMVTDNDDCVQVLRISYAERAQLLIRAFVEGTHTIQGEYSRIVRNIARELRQLERESAGSFTIGFGLARFAMSCANPTSAIQRKNALDLCIALGLIQHVVCDSPLAIYRAKPRE